MAWGRLRVNHALYLTLENRPGEARRLLGEVAAEGGSAGRRAGVFLKELALLSYPAPEATAVSLDASDPELLRALGAYLREEGDYVSPPAGAALSGSVLAPKAPEGAGFDPAAHLRGNSASSINPAGLVLLAPEAPWLAEALSLRRARRWTELWSLLAKREAVWRSSPARPVFELLLVRAGFETAHFAGLEEIASRGVRFGVFHRDLAGPALYLFQQAGRGDEALLLLHRLARSRRLVAWSRMAEFLGGPPALRPFASREEIEALAGRLKAWASNPLKLEPVESFLPPLLAPAHGKFPFLGTAPARWLAQPQVEPPSAGMVVAPHGDADRKKAPYALFSAGEWRFEPAEPLSLGSIRVAVRGWGEPAEGQWPILLLRVNGETCSEIFLCSAEPRDFVREVPLREPLRSVSLIYTNNRVAGPDGGDRNAFAAEIYLAAGKP
jgi:hypothetical protein